MLIKMLRSLLKALNTETNPNEISRALMLGMIIGLTPFLTLHNLIIFIIAFALRTHLASFFLSLSFFSLAAYSLDPVSDHLGTFLLEAPGTQPLWTYLYQYDVFRIFQLNHSLTLGSLVIAFSLSIPFYYLNQYLIIRYRKHLMEWIKKNRLIRVISASRIAMFSRRLLSAKS